MGAGRQQVSRLSGAGWQVRPGFAEAAPGHFHAVHAGAEFGHPERGIIALLAAPFMESDAPDATSAARLALHGIAEGYFGARRTLSPSRAAAVALHSMNDWLASQIRPGASAALAPVSITGVIFAGPRAGILQAGNGNVRRQRGNEVTALADQPTGARAIGAGPQLLIDYQEEAVQPGDVLLLTAGGAQLRLEILAAPQATAMTELAGLKLRPPPREGDVWDGFKIGKTIHQGRYTVVKAAYDEVEQRQVALKIPLPAMLQDEIFAAGFMREAWIGATVRGPGIARYIELPAERRSSLYMVMPLYDGVTLEARLHRQPPVSLPEGIGIALKLCEAVQDLAAIQVVHRDLKPDNIMLLAGREVKLLDLGLAYLPGIDQADATRPGGTLRYMAPELLRGVPAGARSEVYALAVTIYRMFAGGAYPFGQREALPLARLRPDLPGWLGHVLQTALAADPGTRFADAGELARALNEGLLTDAQPPAPARGRPSKLQLWQAATLLFAIGFFILLARLLA